MIQQNVPLKLPPNYLTYRLIQSIIIPIIFWIVLLMIDGSENVTQTVNGQVSTVDPNLGPLVVIGVPFLILCFSVIYSILYVKMFSFIVSAEQISITSGVLFPQTKNVQYRQIQNVSANRGPLLMLFGLANLQGYTSNPAQITVTYDKNGRGTTHQHPDINLVLTHSDIESLRTQIAKAAEAEAVRVIQPTPNPSPSVGI